MRKKCLAWKSGLAGAIAREKMVIFWLGKPRGAFRIEFVIFPFWGPVFSNFCVILRNFTQTVTKNQNSRPFRAIPAPDSSSPHGN